MGTLDYPKLWSDQSTQLTIPKKCIGRLFNSSAGFAHEVQSATHMLNNFMFAKWSQLCITIFHHSKIILSDAIVAINQQTVLTTGSKHICLWDGQVHLF